MKKLITILLIASGISATAQQQNLNGHYYFSPYLVNTAVAGANDFVDASLSYRQNWVGFENAPKSYYGSVHLPLGISAPITYPLPIYSVALQDTLTKLARDTEAKAMKVRQGVGLAINSNSQSTMGQNTFTVSYARHYKLGEEYLFSAGLGLGAMNFSTDFSETRFSEAEVAIASNTISFLKPTLELGLMLYSKKMYVGYSSKQDLNNGLDFGLGKFSKLRLHHYLIGGADFMLGEDITLSPSLLARMVKGAPNSAVFNVRINYANLVDLGIGYRTTNALVMNVGVHLGSSFGVNYSYDMISSGLKQVSNGSHQISINYAFSKLGTITRNYF